MRNHYLHTEIRRDQLLEYGDISTLTRHLRCPRSYAFDYREHHPNTVLTTSQGLRLGNYISRYGVYHPSQALTVARGQRPLMYGVPPLHSMLEEDSCYSRNALGTRTVTYWLSNTWEHLIALLNTSAPEDAHYVLTIRRTCRGRLRRPEGLKLHASLSLSHTGTTVRDMGQGYLHRP
jgi:hypothetical protein